MSGVWRKTLVYLGLVEEPEEHDELPEQLDRPDRYPDQAGEPDRTSPGTRVPAIAAAGGDPGNVRRLRATESGSPHVRAMQQGPARVATVSLTAFEDVERIGERYRTGQPVLFDLGQVDRAVSRRVIDFVSGVTYALRGRLLKAGPRAFLLVPDGVEVPLGERRRLSEMGYDIRPGADA